MEVGDTQTGPSSGLSELGTLGSDGRDTGSRAAKSKRLDDKMVNEVQNRVACAAPLPPAPRANGVVQAMMARKTPTFRARSRKIGTPQARINHDRKIDRTFGFRPSG